MSLITHSLLCIQVYMNSRKCTYNNSDSRWNCTQTLNQHRDVATHAYLWTLLLLLSKNLQYIDKTAPERRLQLIHVFIYAEDRCTIDSLYVLAHMVWSPWEVVIYISRIKTWRILKLRCCCFFCWNPQIQLIEKNHWRKGYGFSVARLGRCDVPC